MRKRVGRVCEGQTRQISQAAGLAPCNNNNYFYFANNIEALSCGVMERILMVPQKDAKGKVVWGSDGFPVLAKPPAPIRHVWDDHAYFVDHIAKEVGTGVRATAEQFVADRTPDTRDKYSQANVKYELYGINRKHSHPNAFIKFEGMEEKSYFCPRIILASDPIFNLRFGMFTTTIEQPIYDAIDKIFDESGKTKVVQKGCNAEQVAANISNAFDDVENGISPFRVINQGDDNVVIVRVKVWRNGRRPPMSNAYLEYKTVALTIDAARWDQHVHIDTVKYKQSLYRKCYQKNGELPELEELMLWQREYEIKGWAKSALDGNRNYKLIVPKCRGRVRSGDMDTSLGNIFIACALLHGFLEFYGKTGHFDELEQFKQRLRNYGKLHGFTLKVEGEAFIKQRIEFCQQSPINDGTRWSMVPNLNALTKHSQFRHSKKDAPEIMSQIGVAGRVLCNQIPIFQSFYGAFPDVRVRKTKWDSNEWRGTGLSWQTGIGHRGMTKMKQRAVSSPTTQARFELYLMTNITPSEQIDYERDLDDREQGLTFSPWFCHWKKPHPNFLQNNKHHLR